MLHNIVKFFFIFVLGHIHTIYILPCHAHNIPPSVQLNVYQHYYYYTWAQSHNITIEKNIIKLHTCTSYGLNHACSFGGSTRETNLLGHMAIPYFASVPWLWHKFNQLTVSAPALPSGTRLRLNNLVNP